MNRAIVSTNLINEHFYFKVWSFDFIVWSVFFIVGILNSSHPLVVAVCTNGIRLCSMILISVQKEFVRC